jgi:hypothetical protein
MASHTPHPDTHEHGLADGCPRCDELAERPLELDHENMLNAWDRMLAVEWGNERYRSGNEAKLCHRLYEMALWLERYTPIDPRMMALLVPA